MTPRKICVVTSGRADYGILRPLIRAIQRRSDLSLELVVTGTHTSSEHGMTLDFIEKDGFPISAVLVLEHADTSHHGVAKTLAGALTSFSQYLTAHQPDICVVLGDRFEIFGIAQAALLHRVPLAHLHGGERTEGLIDESIRHAITKLATFHFVATNDYRLRVLQLGEPEENVFCHGSPVVDSIREMQVLSRADVEKALGLLDGEPYLLVTYHPRTLASDPCYGIRQLLEALCDFQSSHRLVFTAANADPAGNLVNQEVKAFCAKRQSAIFLHSLGSKLYLNAVRYCAAVVGNSSSGIIEAPLLGKAVVNIGSRQGGRLLSASIASCDENAAEIRTCLQHVLSPNFQNTIDREASPYQAHDASENIAETLAHVSLKGLDRKRFIDSGEQQRGPQ